MPATPLELLRPLPVEPTFATWRGHRVARYNAGSGQPLLIVHSIHAAASVFEMRRPFMALQDSFRVHAADFLGYGNSDRPERRYQASDYIDQLEMQLHEIGEPVSVIASSLGSAYAIAAAARNPGLVRSMILICPVGINQLAAPPDAGAWAFYRVLRGPFGRAIFSGLTSRSGVRYFLRTQGYADPRSIDDETFKGFYEATQRPGAYYAPICFVSGLLNCDIKDDFARLECPLLIVWGRQATTTPLSQADAFLERNRCATLSVVEGASLLVQDERPDEFLALARDFLK